MFKIFAHLAPCPLGDFVDHAVLVSSIRAMFEDSELYVHFRNDRPYKRAITMCIPNAKWVYEEQDFGPGLPVGFFNSNHGRPDFGVTMPDEARAADLILSGSMLNHAMLNSIPTVPLEFPPILDSYKPLLCGLGLDPGKWVACVYWKQPGYMYRRDNAVRDIHDSSPYMETISHIVNDLGGQVVRLGHHKMAQPLIKGVVDLAGAPIEAQIYAATISRFMIASGSGPASFGPAFNVPTAVTDQNLCYGAWNNHDYIVTQSITHGGETLSGFDAFQRGWLFTDWSPKGEVSYERNTAAQLIAVADEMFIATEDCPGWRANRPQTIARPLSNVLEFPIRRYYRSGLLIPPSQRSLSNPIRFKENIHA